MTIEQVRQEVTWHLRKEVLYPAEPLSAMAMEEDNNGIHFGAFEDDRLVGVVSLFRKGDDFQFRKFAVVPSYQGKGIGNTKLSYITEFAVAEGGKTIWCNARSTAVGFYLKHNFQSTGKFFSKNGLDYQILEKSLLTNPRPE